jgi:hypothetical protein
MLGLQIESDLLYFVLIQSGLRAGYLETNVGRRYARILYLSSPPQSYGFLEEIRQFTHFCNSTVQHTKTFTGRQTWIKEQLNKILWSVCQITK